MNFIRFQNRFNTVLSGNCLKLSVNGRMENLPVRSPPIGRCTGEFEDRGLHWTVRRRRDELTTRRYSPQLHLSYVYLDPSTSFVSFTLLAVDLWGQWLFNRCRQKPSIKAWSCSKC